MPGDESKWACQVLIRNSHEGTPQCKTSFANASSTEDARLTEPFRQFAETSRRNRYKKSNSKCQGLGQTGMVAMPEYG